MKKNNNEIEDLLLKTVKKINVHSSSLCCHSIILSALQRGLTVKILSENEIKEACVKSGQKYRPNYHKVGHVFQISNNNSTFTINKSRFFEDSNKLNFSKKNIKNKSAKENVNSPKGFATKRDAFDVQAIKKNNLRYPLVIKPIYGSMGKGVVLGIETQDQLIKKIRESDYNDLMIEEQIDGDEYRIYILGGKVFGAVARSFVHVVGNGIDNIEQLIEEKNKIKITEKKPPISVVKALDYLKKNGRSQYDIPLNGEMVKLGEIKGRSSGGDIIDISEDIPKYILNHISEYAKLFTGSLCVGIDIIGNGSEVYVLEVNRRPQLSSLLKPDNGAGRNIADAIVLHLFPESNLQVANKSYPGKIKNAIYKAKINSHGFTISTSDNSNKTSALTLHRHNDETYSYYKSSLNINRLMLYSEAYKSGFSVSSWKNNDGSQRWSITGSKGSIIFRQNMPSLTSQSTRNLTNNKEKTKQQLERNGVRCPKGIMIDAKNEQKAVDWFLENSQNCDFMAVVKPFNGASGRGVTSKIRTTEQLIAAITSIPDQKVVIEEYIPGHDHRLLVVSGKFKYAIKRHPAFIIGDGRSTIEDLVDHKNKIRSNNPYTGQYPLTLDESLRCRLSNQGYQTDSILEKDKKISLQDIANIGAGGDSEDITDIIHPDFIEIAQQAYNAFSDLAFCGIDLIAEDITNPASHQKYAVIEINANCDLAMHHFPTYGMPRNAAGAIIESLPLGDGLSSFSTKKIVIFGKVQGVGLRKWMLNQAKQKGISGYVKNLPDGSVEAIIQGTEAALYDLIRDCNKGSKLALVRKIEIENVSEIKDYDIFSII